MLGEGIICFVSTLDNMVPDYNDRRRNCGAKISRSSFLIQKRGSKNGLMKERGKHGEGRRGEEVKLGSLGCPIPSCILEGLNSA